MHAKKNFWSPSGTRVHDGKQRPLLAKNSVFKSQLGKISATNFCHLSIYAQNIEQLFCTYKLSQCWFEEIQFHFSFKIFPFLQKTALAAQCGVVESQIVAKNMQIGITECKQNVNTGAHSHLTNPMHPLQKATDHIT